MPPSRITCTFTCCASRSHSQCSLLVVLLTRVVAAGKPSSSVPKSLVQSILLLVTPTSRCCPASSVIIPSGLGFMNAQAGEAMLANQLFSPASLNATWALG
ncbi:hypothetical protein Y032_0005g2660 [Ancylostoma ceylanicum]|uniref:Secreted protein n=1 Tax=Ancylostoma ceylanicum TaxID=53326 RepID=A0A016VSS4_9BILA|nr:hypothetical protein Y032_0005g2660 [Ancylostoma ceylanicum]